MITPEQLAKAGTEHAHQTAFFQWVAMRFQHPQKHMFFAVPNGGDRNISVAASMKAEGVKPGVPDVFWPVPMGPYAGLWLELKRPGLEGRALGGRSDKQEKWHRDLIGQQYAVATVYGWEAMTEALKWYSHPMATDFFMRMRQKGDHGDCLFVAGNATAGFRSW